METLNNKIQKHNPDKLPVVIFDPTWMEGSSARYHVENSFKDIRTYEQFLKEVKRLYKGKEIIIAKTGGFWNDNILLSFGTVL